jgi:AcrR family transcriptional regulator
MSGKPQQRQSTFLRRKQIIKSLRKIIIEHGSEHVTVRGIAREAGISEGAIYRHFKSKREILSFLVDYIEESLIADIEKIDRQKNSLEFLENILKNHLSSMEQRRGVSFLVIAEIISLGDKKLNNKIFRVIVKYIGQIKEILLKGLAAEEIRKGINPEAVGIVFFSVIQGLVGIWALSGHNFNLEEMYISLWDFLRGAITNGTPPRSELLFGPGKIPTMFPQGIISLRETVPCQIR